MSKSNENNEAPMNAWIEELERLRAENADLKEANRRLKAEIVKFAKGIKAVVSKQVEKE